MREDAAIIRADSRPAATAGPAVAGTQRRADGSYSVPITPAWSVGCSSSKTGQPRRASSAANSRDAATGFPIPYAHPAPYAGH